MTQVKEIKSHKLPIVKSVSHEDVTHNMGNIINNIIITSFGDIWLLVSSR